MPKAKIKWFFFLFFTTLILIWRLIDFMGEAIEGKYHMTRFGCNLIGLEAETAQIAIIVCCIACFWVTARKHLLFSKLK